MSFAIKIPVLKGVFTKFLRSRATGWGFMALTTLVFGLWYKYDKMGDDLAACLASKPTPATVEFAEELKDIDREKLKEQLAALDAAEHPCLSWVYNPDGED